LSVKQGFLGLLRKALEGDELKTQPRIAAVKPCVPASSLLQSAVTEKGENLLHLSAKSAFIPATKLVVEALGTVQSRPFFNSKDRDGFCPLHLACKRRGDLDSVLLYVYGGALLDTVDARGQTVLHLCFPPRLEVQEYVPVVDKFASDHSLLLTLPLKISKAWGVHGKGRVIGTDTFVLRGLINQFIARGASIIAKDEQGRTPAHCAAANGWGINMDALFSRSGSEAEDAIRECLRTLDYSGTDVLTTTRVKNDKEGEAIVVSEMRKRCIDTIPHSQPGGVENVQQAFKKSPVQSLHTQSPISMTTGSPSAALAPSSPPIHQPIPRPSPSVQQLSSPASPASTTHSNATVSPTSSRVVSPTPSSPRILHPSQYTPPAPSHPSGATPPLNQPSPHPVQPTMHPYLQGPQLPQAQYRPPSSDESKKREGKFLKNIFK
jgi:hypothetical protein